MCRYIDQMLAAVTSDERFISSKLDLVAKDRRNMG
jgi:hypothetical protein